MKKITLILLVAIALTACSNYGKKVNSGHVEVYYKDGISKEEAQHTADLLYQADKTENGNTTNKKSIQLTKEGDSINFRMVIDEKKLATVQDEAFQNIGSVLSDSVFTGKPVNVDLTDNKFKTIRTVHFKKMALETDNGNAEINNSDTETNNSGTADKVTAGNVELYMTEGFDKEVAQRVADYLLKATAPATTISFRIGTDETGMHILQMASSPEKAKNITDDDMYQMAEEVSKATLNGSPLIFQLTSVNFEAFRKMEYPKEK